MNRYIGIAVITGTLAVQTQLQGFAQSTDQVQTQIPQLQPAMSATLDSNLRGPIGGRPAASSSSPLPFTTSSPYSYSEPTEATSSNIKAQPAVDSPVPVTSPLPVTSTSSVASVPSKNTKHKGHGFSPVGAIFGMQDRAFKSSLGLTDRTAKAGLGVTGKTTKEVLKAIF